MPLIVHFSLCRFEDGILTVPLNPPNPIGGWNISFDVYTHPGGETPLITKSCASGFSGVSGITVTNSGQGEFRITIDSVDTSGLELTNYAYYIQHLNSGVRTVLTEGFFTVTP